MRVPQVLVALGRGARLRALHFADGSTLRPSRPYPWLAVGTLDNRLYFVGGSLDAMARARRWGKPGSSRVLVRIDYDATKKGERVYWYHDHEKPFPRLVVMPDGRPVLSGGGYRVSPAGIVG